MSFTNRHDPVFCLPVRDVVSCILIRAAHMARPLPDYVDTVIVGKFKYVHRELGDMQLINSRRWRTGIVDSFVHTSWPCTCLYWTSLRRHATCATFAVTRSAEDLSRHLCAFLFLAAILDTSSAIEYAPRHLDTTECRHRDQPRVMYRMATRTATRKKSRYFDSWQVSRRPMG